tara:strand:- start:210 stop:584 length:375 start_codon:yes stop_codon:yes gene_type:complete
MKTKLEIIEETVKYYTVDKNNRAMDGGDCVYNAEDGSHCAVGRCFNQDFKDEGVELAYNYDSDAFALQHNGSIDHMLMKEYSGHETTFWSDLQNFHDRPRYWGKNFDLTQDGEEAVIKLKKAYS